MNANPLLIFTLLPILFFSCNKDDSPGSTEAEIVEFSVNSSNKITSDYSIIESESQEIHVFSNNYIDDSEFPVSIIPAIEVSPGASVTPASGDEVEFNEKEDFVEFTTKSEDGSNVKDWIAIIRDNQIPNSEFNNWHETQGINGLPFMDVGKYAKSTVWATANMGTSTYKIYGTTKLSIDGNNMVKIQTGQVKTSNGEGSADSTIVIPVTAATLFVGKFDIQGAIENPTDPEKATEFGIPFFYRPKALKLKFRYKSGPQLIKGTLKNPESLFGGFDIENLRGKDNYKIYSILEDRSGENVKTIASFEIRGEDTSDTMEEVILEYQYKSEALPTHMSLVFTSSADGNLWKGAVGSTLIIDDLELVYE